MVTLVNRAKMTTATTGTGTISLGAASEGYQSFADAGVTDGQTVRYTIEDGAAWEVGTGTYTASGTTLSRTVIESSNSDAAISLSGNAVVFATVAASDLQELVTFGETFTLPASDGTSGQVLTTNGAGTLSFSTPASLPAGVIVLWSGSIASIPSGWALCDGTSGTPDLRNRFVVGAGSTYAVDATGGSNTVTLAETNLPSHSHSFSGNTSNTGDHAHSGSTSNTGNHSHNLRYYINSEGNNTEYSVGSSYGLHGTTQTGNTGAHSHNFNTNTTGAHSHSFSGTTGTTGSGTALTITPTYYALAYIMKT